MNVTEWTSISVTEEQKETIEAAQKDADHDGAIGRFIVSAIETNESATNMDAKQELAKVRQELEETRQAVMEATNAAQSNSRMLEELR